MQRHALILKLPQALAQHSERARSCKFSAENITLPKCVNDGILDAAIGEEYIFQAACSFSPFPRFANRG
jgi:hypothetical protein